MMITFDCKDSFIFSDTKTFVKEMFEKLDFNISRLHFQHVYG